MEQILFKVFFNEPLFISDLNVINESSGLELGTTKKTPKKVQFDLSMQEVVELSYEVLGVIVTLGGAMQLVDWLKSKYVSSKDTKIIEIQNRKFDVSNKEEIDRLRLFLEKHFTVSDD